jgi:hypothetical protein
MNNKLTAVQWMNKQMLNFNKSDATWSEIYNQALFMEKEQLYNSWKTSELWSDGNFVDRIEAFEQYYKETYES